MTAEPDAAIVTATISGAPHLKTLNVVYYDGHVGNTTAATYLAYTTQATGSKAYPYFCLTLP
jgi:prepilin-type processing-associated H-X9-DG protein